MPSHSPAAEIHQRLNAPANGLLVTGIVDCALLPLRLMAGLAIFACEMPSHGSGNVGAASGELEVPEINNVTPVKRASGRPDR
ncbi:MAG TPA: hypothetical protein VFG04_00665 [Planctomycetaceae bacterium]|jgi:hypothetical protein|nr:hypothetical protein [Planctomycetaceae bacterium]